MKPVFRPLFFLLAPLLLVQLLLTALYGAVADEAAVLLPPPPKTVRDLDAMRADIAATASRHRESALAIREQEQLVKRGEEALARLKALQSPEVETEESSKRLDYRRQILGVAASAHAAQTKRLADLQTIFAEGERVISFPESEYRSIVDETNRELTRLEEEQKRAESALTAARDELARAEAAAAAIPDSPDTPTQDLLKIRKATAERAEERVIGNARLITLHKDVLITWKRRYDYYNGQASVAEQKQWRKEIEEQLNVLTYARNLLRITSDELRAKERALLNEVEDLALDPNQRTNATRLRRLTLERLDFLQNHDRSLDSFEQIYRGTIAELAKRTQTISVANLQASLLTAVFSVWNFELLITDGQAVTLGKIVSALVLVVLGYYLSRLLARALSRRLSAHSHLAPGVVAAVKTLVFYGLVAAFALLALQIVSIPLTAFAFVGGALAVGVGFGSQHLVNNFISGLMLLIERPIRVGDVIEAGGGRGTVTRIGPRSVTLRTVENTEIIVPNSMLLEKNIVNATFSDPKVRLAVRVSVAYDTNPELVRSELLTVALAHSLVLRTPEPVVFFSDFGDSALIFDLFVWVYMREGASGQQVQSELRFAIFKRFAEKGISIPFPQREVRLLGNRTP